MLREELKIKKTHLRNLAKGKGDSVVIEVAQGISNALTNEISD